jgi:hypothetical protein
MGPAATSSCRCLIPYRSHEQCGPGYHFSAGDLWPCKRIANPTPATGHSRHPGYQFCIYDAHFHSTQRSRLFKWTYPHQGYDESRPVPEHPLDPGAVGSWSYPGKMGVWGLR